MKKMLFRCALAAAICCTALPADARKPKDQEFRHVIVTLADGSTVDGYIKRGWHAESSHLKKENFSFKITPTPDGGEAVRYTADEVASVEYTETTESNPDGIRWESRVVARPSLVNKFNTDRRFVCLSASDERATIYWWKYWDVTTNAKGQTRQLRTAYGIRFHDDDEAVVYPYNLVNTVLLKEKKPGLKEFMKDWFKGPEGKERKREAKDDSAWMLRMYADYLTAQNAE